MPTKKIKVVLFDFGRVLSDFDHKKACFCLSKFSTLTPDEIYNVIFPKLSGLHNTGQYDSIKFYDEVKRNAKLKNISFEEFSHCWADIFTSNNEMERVLSKIKGDIKLFILSDTDPVHWTYISRLPIVKKFFDDENRIIRSYDVKVEKPDDKMYNEAIKRAGVKPEEILYIDDVQEFVETARDFGINAEKYDCTKDPITRMEEIFKKYEV